MSERPEQGSQQARPEDLGDVREDFLLRSRTVKRSLLVEPDGPSVVADAGGFRGADALLEDYLRQPQDGTPTVSAAPSAGEPGGRKDSLDSLIRRNDPLPPPSDPKWEGAFRLPDTGDSLFGFLLGQELGRGAFARVFLAEQTDLASRPVVLKVSGIEGSEAQTLAQLQHTHIVPIFSVHESALAGVRALCMPYFGGASLSAVLTELFARSPKPTLGRELVEALEKVAAPDPDALCESRRPSGDSSGASAGGRADGQTPRTLLGRMSYAQAAAWVGARLAEGLHHAHQRGVLHRDVKPSNVLLGADGTPMLLDFNLAHDCHDADRATLGGTVAYMGPEHLLALASRDPAQAARVDQRSDVYSLGMVIYEMLVGRRPFDRSGSYSPAPLLVEGMARERAQAVPSVRQERPDVPWGLESILRRCMAPDPADRYQQAEHVAEDLRCFLADLPLRYAPELSLAERARKWARRHPRLTSSGAVFAAAAVLLVFAALSLWAVRDRLVRTRQELAGAQAERRKRSFEEAVVRAQFYVHTRSELRDHLGKGVAACEEALDLYGARDGDDWQGRPDWRRLAPEERSRLAEDVRELLLLLAGAKLRLAPSDRAAAAEALRLLERAEAIPNLPPCRAVWEDRAACLDRLGDTKGASAARERAGRIEPATARDHYLLALTHSRTGDHARAVKHLDEALRLEPRHYWSWVQRGLCQQERGEHALAAADFGVSVGLWPQFAWGHFNRGCALAQCGKRAEAAADYTTAIRLDPELSVAYLNRGLLRLELEQPGDALADFDAAAAQGYDDAALHSGRGAALERLGRHQEADLAFRLARRKAESAPAAVRARLLWVQGFAVARRDPGAASEAFEAALKEEPANPQALYGRGMLRERKGRDAEALACYDRALESWPGFIQARRARAVVLARRGEIQAASQEINWCLEHEPRSGATLYAAACVAALAAQGSSGDRAAQAADQALRLLREALALGYGLSQLEEDRDLDGIRQDRRFQALREESRSRIGRR